ncbi:hypothetical protein [Salinigranum rubrum]|uniref:hypothetical protein n=1 Tax=Salinigranum rubrum TaxID=755307 RepID=UPI0013A56FB3|nr:hypothetical protein [Salinigranum rubrum]
MTPQTRPSHVAEWAELVGDSVPDVVRDGDGSDSASLAAGQTGDAAGRWADADGSSNGQ